VTVSVGDAVIFSDSNLLVLTSTVDGHSAYGWFAGARAASIAAPVRTDTVRNGMSIITFADSAAQSVQVTKQVTEISPRSLKIVIKLATQPNAPGNLLDYSAILPGSVYAGATFSTDGNGYDLSSLSPLSSTWAAQHNGGHGDDMRYNISTFACDVSDLGGAPAKLVYTLSETPISSGDPPNIRGWRLFAGLNSAQAPFYKIRNTYQFESSTPFERTIEVRISWK
jgi:hypothetical protein